MLNPKEFVKIGKWPNGEYFNSLYLAGEKPQLHKILGKVIGQENLIAIDDNIFYVEEKVEIFKNLVKKEPEKFLQKFNALAIDQMEKLKEYVESNSQKDFTKLTNKELSKEKTNFEDQFLLMVPYLNPLLYVADSIEKFIIEKIPNLKFDEIRPSKKISAERLNDILLEGKIPMEKVLEEFGWYTMILLRGKPLTMDELEEIKKMATHSKPIKISENPLIKHLQDLMWIKFERIDTMNIAFYKMMNLYKEIFKRINLDIKYWDVFLHEELTIALETGEIPKNLDSRFEHRGIIMENKVITHLTIDECKAYHELFIPKPKITNIIKGRPACKGKVTGKVKVVKEISEISKVEEGDILVAIETFVQFEPYMHKTAAMIVEVGGLLTHTAIFAREFNIPTILGVEQATELFEDDELVEVDADKGIVKKLK